MASLHYVTLESLTEEYASKLPVCTTSITPTLSLKRVSTSPKRLASIILPDSPLYSILSKSDISPGVYEGGFTCWECSKALCEYLSSLCVFHLLICATLSFPLQVFLEKWFLSLVVGMVFLVLQHCFVKLITSFFSILMKKL